MADQIEKVGSFYQVYYVMTSLYACNNHDVLI